LRIAKVFNPIINALHGQVPLLSKCLNDDPAAFTPNDHCLRVVQQPIRQVKIHFAVLHRHHIPTLHGLSRTCMLLEIPRFLSTGVNHVKSSVDFLRKPA
jgi:hypothetical protein